MQWVHGPVRASSCRVAMIRPESQIEWPAVHESNTDMRMCVPKCGWDCKVTAVIHNKYPSSEVNKSIAISIIDWNIHLWFTAKLRFNQKRPIWSTVSDGLTNIYKYGFNKNNTKNSSKKFGWKIWFQNSELTWRSTSINPKKNRDLNQSVLHHLSTFGDSCFNRWWVMVRTQNGVN